MFSDKELEEARNKIIDFVKVAIADEAVLNNPEEWAKVLQNMKDLIRDFGIVVYHLAYPEAYQDGYCDGLIEAQSEDSKSGKHEERVL